MNIMITMNTLNICFFIIAAVICIGAFVPALSNGKGITLSKKAYTVLLVAAFAVAVGIRLWKFGIVPGGINQDGAMAGVDAKALSDYGTDRFGMRFPVHFTAWGFGQMSVLMSYLMVPFIKLFGLCSLSLRLPTLIVSLAGLVFLYLFCRDGFGRNASLVILFIAAINPWQVMQSRWAIDCNLLPHFMIAGIFFLNRSIGGKAVNLIISMLIFGLCMYCYGISIYTVTLYLLIACIWLISSGKISVKRAGPAVCVYLLIAWPFILCMIINAFGLESIETPWFTIPYFPGTIRTGDILFFAEDVFSQIAVNLKSTFSLIFQLRNDSTCNMIPGFGTMYVFSVPFMLLGFAYSIVACRKNNAAVLTLLLFLVGLFDGIITANANTNRLNIIFYSLIIFCGLGVRFCFGHVRAFLPAVVLMYASAFCIFVCTYFGSYSGIISDIFLEDFGKALVYAESISDEDTDYIITANSQYKNAGHVSEILTLYYHDIDARYFQSDDYSARYRYRNISDGDIGQENTVYVCAEEELENFSLNDYDIYCFGRFYVVKERK